MATQQTQNVGSSGSDANSFQPQTQNPQGNAGSGLQQNQSGLQTSPNQAGLTQQNLLKGGELTVTTQSGSTGSVTPATPPSNQSLSVWSFLVLVIGAVVIFIVVKRILKPSLANEVIATETAVEPEVEVSIEPEVASTTPKKTKAKSKAKHRPSKKRKKSKK